MHSEIATTPPMVNETRAIVRIGHSPRADAPDTGSDYVQSDVAAHFKRLALFFDTILFVRPDYWIVKDEVAADSTRVIRKPDGGFHFRDIDPFRDTDARVVVPIHRLGDELAHTLSYLVERGIANEVHPTQIAYETDVQEFEAVRSEFGRIDIADARFIGLSGSSDTEFRAETTTATPINGSGKTRLLHSVVPPKAVRDSSDITSILFAAEHTSSSPVFLDPAHQAQLAYRYEQYKRGIEIIGSDRRTQFAVSKFLDEFGAVTFHLGNALLEDAKIAALTVEQIVELRESMEDERRLFVSEHLVEATALVDDNPWSPQLRAELERIARGKLATDLARYRRAADDRVEGFRARAAERLIAAGAMATIGGANSALNASFIPGVTPWLLATVATLGALGAAAQPLLDIRKEAIEAKLEEAQAGRSSIAYLDAITN
jgi:hypothetical protein